MEPPDLLFLSHSFQMLMLNALIAWDVVILVISILVLLVFSGIFSASEVAFFSLTQSQLDEIKENNTKASDRIEQLLQQPKRLLASLLIANNFVNIGIVIISSYLTTKLIAFEGNEWLIFIIQVILITLIILIFGESLPKTLATQKSKAIAIHFSSLLLGVNKIFYPFTFLLVNTTNVIDKKIGNKNSDISLDEISNAIELTSDSKTSDDEKKILKGIVKFGNVEVAEIMTRRMDVIAVDIASDFKEVVKTIMESGYSRIPVYEKTVDSIVGIIYIKDFLQHLDKEDFQWTALIRKPYFVPEGKKINDLLSDFQQKKIHMAIVVDEYGGTSGIITLEDIIEEIIGEISDEFDTDDQGFSKISENCFIFEAKTSLLDFCRYVNVPEDTFDDIKGDAESLGGLILEITGELPERNDIIKYKNFSFRIEAADKRKINRIRVIINRNE